MNKKQLLQMLTKEFRKTGFDGLSLSQISKATGLGKASLYHHFPNGKKEMALGVLKNADEWIQSTVLDSVSNDLPAEEKLNNLFQILNDFYFEGENSCLLDVMTIENASDNELVFQSKEILLNFTHIFAKLAQEFGRTKEESIQIAEISISLLQGGLIQTRILKDNRIFKSQVEFIKQLLKNGIHQKV